MQPIFTTQITKFKGAQKSAVDDILVREIKLEIYINGKRFGAVMATPTDQEALAAGYLISENLIASPEDIENIELSDDALSVRVKAKINEKRLEQFDEEKVIISGCGRSSTANIDPEAMAARSIKGEVKFKVEDILDDFIIARSDGTPTYNFTVVIDDALIGVTDVIRGDDHLSNTPKQIVLYEALGFKVPKFYHVAMINGEDGKKLSKRHGATDVMEYKKMGYLPEALLNFLVRLGWSHGDDEIFTIEDMLKYFNPNDINKSSSTYNAQKLDWLNSHYIKTLPYERLAHDMLEFGVDFKALVKGELLLNSLRERSKTLIEMANSANAIINAPKSYDEKAWAKFINENSKEILAKFAQILDRDLDAKGYEELTNKFLEQNGLKLKDLAQALRVALTGSSVSPSIFEVLEVVGSNEIKNRIQNLLKEEK